MYTESSFGFNVYITPYTYNVMVCHICLSDNTSRKIDRLDLCDYCFKQVTNRMEKEEKNADTTT